MKTFNEQLQKQIALMQSTGKLFRVAISGDALWDIYLKSFPAGTDPIFRDPLSTTHNCNLCKNFIRRYANIVALTADFKIISLFDNISDSEYVPSAKALSEAIKKSEIISIFTETFDSLNALPYESCKKNDKIFTLGMARNIKRYTREEAEKYGVVKPNEIREFTHMSMKISSDFVDNTGKSVENIASGYNDAKNVFKRGMETISLDTLLLVKDLINQDSLLDGKQYLKKLESFIKLKREYDALAASQRDNWCWVTSYNLPFAKFRNELIGVLCTELSEGVELNEACRAWNKRVDPVNFMKTKAPITKAQIEAANKFIIEFGYEGSFARRFATIGDIRASEILHLNSGTGTALKNVSILDGIKPASTRHKRSEFKNVEEINIDKFMADILPSCSAVEVFLQNNHEGHFVNLTTAVNPEAKNIFKWDNPYSWTFNGNLAGKSQIKQAVKNAGGVIEAPLRFSMIWNESGKDNSDLDAWCEQPNQELIGFRTGFRKDQNPKAFSSCGGQLDLDNTGPGSALGVENIYFQNLTKLKNGTYKFHVHQFSNRNSKGFKAEIEVNGEVYTYEYNRPVTQEARIQIAEVTYKNGNFEIVHKLPEAETSSKTIYNLETNNFHKVNLICTSPNHWGTNAVGNKHYLFMLENCHAETDVRTFHNENLNSELTQHRAVLEVLAAKATIPPTGPQLAGLGFNATVRDEVILKLHGTHKRVVKVKF